MFYKKILISLFYLKNQCYLPFLCNFFVKCTSENSFYNVVIMIIWTRHDRFLIYSDISGAKLTTIC